VAFITDVMREAVGRVEVRTTLGPPIVIDDPFAPAGGEPSFAVRLLKPSITLFDKGGVELHSIAPEGDPGTSKWPLVVFSVGILLALNLRGLLRKRG
jgi:hypothetical protein